MGNFDSDFDYTGNDKWVSYDRRVKHASMHDLRTVFVLYREYLKELDGDEVIALVRQNEETVVQHYKDGVMVASLEQVLYARYVIGRLDKTGVTFWEKRTNKWVHAAWTTGEDGADFTSGKANLYGYARLTLPPGALIW
jgi:hypothetical protein